MKKVSTITFFLHFCCAICFSQNKTTLEESPLSDTTTVSLFDLSLNDLLNLKVTVVSKREELLSDAPGMVTSYSATDIENYGYYSLTDLSSITSGYSNYTAYGEKVFETRGQKAGSWNNQKHLLLVDGIPVNHARAYSAPIDNQLPLFFADRVEFMTGPGSVLYGTSAFYGVVSVTPKSLDEIGSKVESKISTGNYLGETRLMANGLSKTEEGEASLSVGYYKRRFSGDFLGSTGIQNPNLRNWNDDNSFFINGSYKLTHSVLKGLKMGFIYMRRYSHMGDGWSGVLSVHNQQTWEEVIPYLKYDRDLSKKLKLSSYVKYNNSQEHGQFPTGNQGTTNGFDFTFANIEALGELQYEISTNHSVIGGVNYDWRRQLGSPQTYDYTADSLGYYYGDSYGFSEVFNIASIFAQYQGSLPVLSGLNLTLGGRLDNGISETNKYSQLLPRVAGVLKLNSWLNFKVMYAEALRTPGLREIVGNVEAEDRGVGESPVPVDLQAETIGSFETGFTVSKKHFNFSFVYFNNTTKNSLEGFSSQDFKDSDGNNINYFVNSNNDIKAQGVEVDAVFVLNPNLKIFANYAVAKAYMKDESTGENNDFKNVPDQKINAGITYKLPIDKFPATVTLISKNVEGFFVDESIYGVSRISGYNFLDLNFLFPITKNIGVECQVKNLTDQRWYQPSVTNDPERDVLSPGRTFLFTMSVKL